MAGGYMNDNESEFFVAGAKTYLDVDLAVAAFRRQVQGECERVVKEKLNEINQACESHWRFSSLRDYIYHQSSPYNAVDLGKKILVEGAGSQGGLYFHLRLARKMNNINEDSLDYGAVVQLYRGSQDVLLGLWAHGGSAASGAAFETTTNSLIFKKNLTEDTLLDFCTHLAQATDDFITFMGKVGGLMKYLPALTEG
jgi:hypothetical protein